jgi:uncharacterized protein (TIGR01619 family)
MGLSVRILLGVPIAGFLVFVVVALGLYMGIIQKLFAEKDNGEAGITASNYSIPKHQEDWAVYLSTIDNEHVGSIMVDLGLKSIVPIATRPVRVRIDVTMRHPSESGLPLPEEFESLNEIDQGLSGPLSSKLGAVYAGHLYCRGIMSLYFYFGENVSFESTVAEAMKAFPNYRFTLTTDREENWVTYLELLYPLPIQMQSIHNQKVVDNLRKEGDGLETKRPVDHMIYFRTERDIDRFLAEIKGEGFAVVAREPTEVEGFSWSVLLRRDDAVDPRSVDDYVLYLWQKAYDANGDYDGWGSTIVRE